MARIIHVSFRLDRVAIIVMSLFVVICYRRRENVTIVTEKFINHEKIAGLRFHVVMPHLT